MVDLEQARADRYQKLFSVVAADFRAPGWEEMPSRKQGAVLRDLGVKVAAGIRTSDHAAHARRGEHHIIGVVLPETAGAGARIFADNLNRLLIGFNASAKVRVVTATHPGDPAAMKLILDLFRELDRSQRPAIA
jgi:hypothetical protein